MIDEKIDQNNEPIENNENIEDNQDIEQEIKSLKSSKKIPSIKKSDIKIKKPYRKKFKKLIPLLKYYNSDLLIPCNRSQVIPGNLYVFNYSNYKHVPTPLVFYIGTNPRYQTLEGISLQYLSIGERKRLISHFQKKGLLDDVVKANSIKIKNLHGEERHIFPRKFSSDSIYNYLKHKLKKDVIFYRRYKFSKISSRLYVVPIEAIDRVTSINTPFKSPPQQIMSKSKKNFAKIINKI